MGTAGLFESVATVEKGTPRPVRRFEPLTKGLTDFIRSAWQSSPADATLLRLAMRAGLKEAAMAAATEADATEASGDRRRGLLGILAEVGGSAGVSAALDLLENDRSVAVQSAALDVLAGQDDSAVTARLLAYYSKSSPALRRPLREVLLGRPASARAFLE